MKTRMNWAMLLGGALVGLVAVLGAPAADEPAKNEGQLTVVDNNGKEQKLQAWKFTEGTRRLNWLATKEKPVGPEALAFREDNSTNFADGVVTLVPLTRIHSLDYDYKAEKVKLTVATGPQAKDKATLTGDIGFMGTTNKYTVEGDGGAEAKYSGGVEKGFTALKFPAPKGEALAPGRPALLTTIKSKMGTVEHKLLDFQPLFRFADDSEVLGTKIYLKDLTVDLAKLDKITRTAGAGDETVWIVTPKKGDDETLPLLKAPKIDGKDATLVGFVARVPAGYKFFPAYLIKEVEFDVKD
jgi:hypothetical protein